MSRAVNNKQNYDHCERIFAAVLLAAFYTFISASFEECESVLLFSINTMDSDDAEEVNVHVENKYVKDAKVGEGTYAVVYSGKFYLNL